MRLCVGRNSGVPLKYLESIVPQTIPIKSQGSNWKCRPFLVRDPRGVVLAGRIGDIRTTVNRDNDSVAVFRLAIYVRRHCFDFNIASLGPRAVEDAVASFPVAEHIILGGYFVLHSVLQLVLSRSPSSGTWGWSCACRFWCCYFCSSFLLFSSRLNQVLRFCSIDRFLVFLWVGLARVFQCS
jgi:hypothetical protein